MKRGLRYLAGADALGASVSFDIDEYLASTANTEPTEDELAVQAFRELNAALSPQQMIATPNAEGGLTVDGGGVPGEFAPPEAPTASATPLLPSPLEGVSDESWTAFVRAMKIAEPTTVTPNGALGMFEIRLRRLEDLGLMKNVQPVNVRQTGKMGWTGEWVDVPDGAILNQDVFLSSPRIQYRVFATSIKLYAQALAADGEIEMPEDDEISYSGALALLQCCGPRGIESWAEVKKRKPKTIALFEAANGIF